MVQWLKLRNEHTNGQQIIARPLLKIEFPPTACGHYFRKPSHNLCGKWLPIMRGPVSSESASKFPVTCERLKTFLFSTIILLNIPACLKFSAKCKWWWLTPCCSKLWIDLLSFRCSLFTSIKSNKGLLFYSKNKTKERIIFLKKWHYFFSNQINKKYRKWNLYEYACTFSIFPETEDMQNSLASQLQSFCYSTQQLATDSLWQKPSQ